MPGKSFLAGAAEPVLKLYAGKRKFIDPTACTEYIAAMEKQNRLPYKLPAVATLSGKVSELSFGGMQIFVIGSEHEPTVLYLHGGSYFAPPNIFHWDMLTRIAEAAGVRIIAPLYPRAPVHTSSAAYNLLYELCEGFEFDLFMGDSAGGGLALGLAQSFRADGLPFPDELILLSPWLDVSMENDEMRQFEPVDPMLGIYGLKRMGKLWAGSLDVRDPKVSPIYGSFEGIKRLSIFVGTHEIFYPEVMRLGKLLDGTDTEVNLTVGDEMTHVWVAYPMREGREAVSQIAKIIDRKISK